MGLTECRIIHKVYNLLSPSLHWLDLLVSSTHLVQDDLIHSLVQIWYMYLRWYWGWGNLCTEARDKWIDTRYRSSRSFHGFQLTIDWCMVTATSRLWNVLVCDVRCVCRCQGVQSVITHMMRVSSWICQQDALLISTLSWGQLGPELI